MYEPPLNHPTLLRIEEALENMKEEDLFISSFCVSFTRHVLFILSKNEFFILYLHN